MTAFGTETAKAGRYSGANVWDRLRHYPGGNVLIVFVVFTIVATVVGLIYPDDFRFTSEANFRILLRAIPTFGIMALGMGILMIAGEFDLSVGALYTFAPYMMVLPWTHGVPEAIAIFGALGTALLVGLVNGFITLNFNIPSFITTLGTLFIIRSGSRVITGMKPLYFRADETFFTILTHKIFGVIPAQFIWFLVFAGVAYFILNRHRIGNRFYAVGGNPEAARSVGINVYWTKMIAFMLCSTFAAIAGIFSVARQKSVTVEPQLYLELNIVAVCVVGGVSLFGGRGAILGIVLGACILEMVKDVLVLGHAPGYYLEVFIGVVIVVAVIFNTWAAKRY
jgi:simple sugar transport system permease protein